MKVESVRPLPLPLWNETDVNQLTASLHSQRETTTKRLPTIALVLFFARWPSLKALAAAVVLAEALVVQALVVPVQAGPARAAVGRDQQRPPVKELPQLRAAA